MLYLPSICYTIPSKGGGTGPTTEGSTDMAELDMSWVTEYQVVEDPYKGEDARDFEHFDI